MAGGLRDGLPLDSRWIGVDGCRSGWFAVGATADGRVGGDVFEDFESLWRSTGDPDTVLVDQPIGLRDDGVRRCDERAAALLGCRRASVFTTPVRAAILDAPDREAASDVNEAATGKRVSVQAWNLRGKIRELETFLGPDPLAHPAVREAHPELVFAAFNGQPLSLSKSSPEGLDLRLATLEREFDRWAAVEAVPVDCYEAARDRFTKSAIADDDVLDALALLAGARCELTAVPEGVPDDCPRIHYPDRSFDWQTVGYFA